MPKRGDQKVLVNGICTYPPFADVRSWATASVPAPRVRDRTHATGRPTSPEIVASRTCAARPRESFAAARLVLNDAPRGLLPLTQDAAAVWRYTGRSAPDPWRAPAGS